ncbi:MAG: glycosyltransferase family 39 protein [Candidatus Gottesmanbacteria bacterium]|nr:glycosyltransferase family 39 protein [Candidatus Gottesmanbacteria bacterium]
MKRYVWIILIVLLAGFLRFWQLTGVPPALNSDEVAIGYNAYSILKTGKDEYGKPYPLTFRSFDDYKMPMDVYMIAAGMSVFGYGDFAVRFPSAFFGTLTVLCTYILVKKLFKEHGDEYALASSFLLAVSPWSLLFSRSGYGANIAVFFAVLGLCLFLHGLERGALLPFSAIAFSFSVWSYHSSKIFIPLMLFCLAVLFRSELLKKKLAVFTALCVGIILLFPLMKMTLSTQGQLRAVGVTAFGNPDDLKQSVSWIIQDKSNGQNIFSLFHNRRFEYLQTFLRGYFSHFDLNFLFLDASIEKYRAPGMGLLYLFELPFLLIGVYTLIRRRSRSSVVIFCWLLAAPVAAAFTLQLPHPGRTLIFLPSLQIITAIGLVNTLKKMKRRYVLFACTILIMIVSILYFIHQYFIHLPIDDAPYWYVGRKEMVAKLVEYEKEYDTIYVSNTLDFPYIFYLYYRPVDPQKYLAQGGTVSGGFNEQGNHYKNTEFRSISSSLRDPLKKILFAGIPSEVFKESLVVDTIYYPDGTPAIVFFK